MQLFNLKTMKSSPYEERDKVAFVFPLSFINNLLGTLYFFYSTK
jgi:hypothetical protein